MIHTHAIMLEDNRETDDILQERQELIQDVIDRLLSNPAYKAKLLELNAKYLPLKDYNRRLKNYRDDEELPSGIKPITD